MDPPASSHHSGNGNRSSNHAEVRTARKSDKNTRNSLVEDGEDLIQRTANTSSAIDRPQYHDQPTIGKFLEDFSAESTVNISSRQRLPSNILALTANKSSTGESPTTIATSRDDSTSISSEGDAKCRKCRGLINSMWAQSTRCSKCRREYHTHCLPTSVQKLPERYAPKLVSRSTN